MEFGAESKIKLMTCHPKLKAIADEAIKLYDFSVICGGRNEADQNEAFLTGKSKEEWPNSKHNKSPSQAMDLYPYPIDLSGSAQSIHRFYYLAGTIMAVADKLNIKIRWGGSFSTIVDLPHFELLDNEI